MIQFAVFATVSFFASSIIVVKAAGGRVRDLPTIWAAALRRF